MAAPPIRIRVGAAADSSIERVFASIEARAKRAARVIAASMKMIATSTKFSDKDFGKGADAAASAWIRATERMRRGTREVRDESFAAFREIGRVAERELNRAARAQHNAQARAGRQFAERTSHRATRFLTPNAPLGSYAARAAGDIARGIGVDYSLSGSLQRSVSLEKSSVDLTNAAYVEGADGPAGQRQDAARVRGEVRGTAKKFGFASEDTMAGLMAFKDKTGDLATARALLDSMARLSKATGTNLGDMIDAAGDVSTKLGGPAKSLAEAEERAAAVTKIMEVMAGQGKVGAVEIKDLSVQMARIAGNAGDFEGDRGQNIIKMGALAQLARQGTATSAADAARSVSSLSTTFKKTARISAFEKEGVDVFSDKSRTKIRDPFEIIKDALTATGGDIPKMNKMFMDVLGGKAVGTLSRTFKDAGGGEKGRAAVDELVKTFTEKATISREEQDKSVANAMQTTASKAAVFQERLDEVGEKLRAKLLPTLDKLSPSLLELADTLGNVIGWILENPWKSIGLAITTSIARAGLESTLRAGIERLILGANGGGLGGRAAGIGGAVANAGGALTIAAMAVTSLVVGMAIIDQLFDKSQQKQREAVEGEIGLHNLDTKVRTGKHTPEEAKKLTAELVGKSKEQTAKEREQASGTGRAAGDFLVGDVLGFFSKDIKEAIDSRRKLELERVGRAEKAQVNSEILLRNLNATLEGGITIKNMPGAPDGRDTQK